MHIQVVMQLGTNYRITVSISVGGRDGGDGLNEGLRKALNVSQSLRPLDNAIIMIFMLPTVILGPDDVGQAAINQHGLPARFFRGY